MATEAAGGQDPTKPAAPATPPADPKVEAPKPGEGGDGKGTPDPAKAEPGKDGAAAAGEGGKDGKGADPKPEAPQVIELAIPEGAEVFVDDAIVGKVLEAAKAAGWTQEQAQEQLEAIADEMAANAEALRVETVNDPVYGGKNLEQTQQLAERAIDRMWPKGSKEATSLRKLLTSTGQGNNRLILGGLANIGKLMQEDQPVSGSPGGGEKLSTADRLYGKTTPAS